jgi:hypothetical protein
MITRSSLACDRDTRLESCNTEAKTNIIAQIATFRSHFKSLDVGFEPFDIGKRDMRIPFVRDPIIELYQIVSRLIRNFNDATSPPSYLVACRARISSKTALAGCVALFPDLTAS